MNELMNFQYEGIQVRTVDQNGEPWFVLKDVCDVLELSNSRMVADRLDEDEVSLTYITDSIGRQQETTIINESGLYNVILRSDKQEAKQFRKWVTSEVLPSIRRHGMYATPQTIETMLDDPDSMILVLTKLKEERSARLAAEKTITIQAPKVIFADAVSSCHDGILIRALAKILNQNGCDIGQNRLYEVLRSEGYLIRNKGRDFNMPTQRSMDLGVLAVKEGISLDANGESHTNRTTLVTGKGQIYFVNHFCRKGDESQ